jgi:hypothetical protein
MPVPKQLHVEILEHPPQNPALALLECHLFGPLLRDSSFCQPLGEGDSQCIFGLPLSQNHLTLRAYKSMCNAGPNVSNSSGTMLKHYAPVSSVLCAYFNDLLTTTY